MTRHAIWNVTYEGVDITDEISRSLVTVEYGDSLSEADELQLTLEDRAGKWRAGWFPSEGDRLALQFGWRGAPLIDAGQFRVDEVELSGSAPTIRALSVPQTDELRTPRSVAWEDTTLAALLETVASALGLTVEGTPPVVPILRATQSNETTLAFVRRLAREWGYTFSIRGARLVFFELAKLEAADVSLTIHRADLLAPPRLKAATQDTYVACEVRWADPQTKELRRTVVYADHARQRLILGGQDEGRPLLDMTAPPSIPTRLLRSGTRGEDVRAWQMWLSGQGYEPGKVDGIFGPVTRAATMRFQSAASIVVDGIAGPETFRAAVEAGFGQARGSGGTRSEVSGRVLRIERRVETLEQAEIMARAALAEANRLRASGSLSILGRPTALAGCTLDLRTSDRLAGKYLVQSSRHRDGRGSGYVTELEVTYV